MFKYLSRLSLKTLNPKHLINTLKKNTTYVYRSEDSKQFINQFFRRLFVSLLLQLKGKKEKERRKNVKNSLRFDSECFVWKIDFSVYRVLIF